MMIIHSLCRYNRCNTFICPFSDDPTTIPASLNPHVPRVHQYFLNGYPKAVRIAFFSWKGHTQGVATAPADRVNDGLVRIEPLKEFNIAVGGMKAFMSAKSPVKPCKTDLGGHRHPDHCNAGLVRQGTTFCQRTCPR